MKHTKPFKRREVIKSGSQISEPIELTNYVIVQGRGKGGLLLRDETTGRLELWQHKQDFAGYCIRIGEKNYEFVSGA